MTDENTMQQRAAEIPTPESRPEVAPQVEDLKVDKWSWGAFMFEPIFLVAIKKYWYLLLFLLYLIPFINLIAIIGVKIFLGLRGRRLALESGAFKNNDEWKGFTRAFDHAGFIMFIVAIVGTVLGIFLAVLGFMTLADKMEEMGGMPFNEAQFEAQMEAEMMKQFGDDFKIDIDYSNR